MKVSRQTQYSQKAWAEYFEQALCRQREMYRRLQETRRLEQQKVNRKQCSDPVKGQHVDVEC